MSADGGPEPDAAEPASAGQPEPAALAESEPRADDWQRLDAKVMFLGPIDAARQFLVAGLVALIGIGSQQPRALLFLTPLLIVGSIAVGALPWLTTRFRLSGDQFVVHTGVLNRKQLTAPLERIRTVDLEASLLRRLLGLAKVTIGTGVDDSRIELDSLDRTTAERLRATLLRRAASASGGTVDGAVGGSVGSSVGGSVGDAAGAADGTTDATDATGSIGDGAANTARGVDVPRSAATPPATAHRPPHRPHPPFAAAQVPQETLAVLDPRWARFAPFSLVRIALAAGAFGALTQFNLPIVETGREVWDWLLHWSLVLVVVGLLVVGLIAWSIAAVVSYLITWWDLRLFREEGNLRLTRGLFTTSSTTVEETRIRGVELREPVLLRSVGGAELKALVTGLDDGVHTVLPQCPSGVAHRVGEQILRHQGPLSVGLRPHGAAARRRAQLRAQLTTTGWVAPVAVAGWLGLVGVTVSGWLALGAVTAAVLWGALVGQLRYAHLGHHLDERHLVVGHGDLTRVRTVLERDGVIGWVVTETLFQRRLGLVSLTATTAAGAEEVLVADIPRDDARALVAALPAVRPFL